MAQQSQPAQEAPKQRGDRPLTYNEFENTMDPVRESYALMAQSINLLRERMKQLEARLTEVEKQMQPKEQPTVEHQPTQQEKQPQEPAQNTHHTTELSQAQIRRMYAIAHSVEMPLDHMKALIQEKFGKDIPDLSREEYDQAWKMVQYGQKKESELTAKQVKRVFAIAKSANVPYESIQPWLRDNFGKEKIQDLTRIEYDQLCSALEKAKSKNAEPQQTHHSGVTTAEGRRRYAEQPGQEYSNAS